MTDSLTYVDPAKPPAPYLGGKRLLSKTIIERISSVEHDGYAEPFVGLGGVFLRRNQRPKTEVINDISGDIATLFRVLQRHYRYFIDFLKFHITSRREFERLVKTDPVTLTDLERAARFLYLQRTAFGGKPSGLNFGVDKYSGARFNIIRLEALLEAVHERLAGVVIENLPWADFIRRYDRTGMLFYLDPPYWGNENDYGRNIFSRDDFKALAEALAKIKGRFLMSLNAVAGVYETFAAFHMDEVDCTYSIANKGSKAVREVIICN